MVFEPSTHAPPHHNLIPTYAADILRVSAGDYFAKEVLLGGAANSDVDGFFTDDPGGYGQEHPSVQSAVQLSDAEIGALQAGTQQAWAQGLELLTAAGKYIAQAYRITPPFNSTDPQACASWMRAQCAVPANESTLVFNPANGPAAQANMSLAAFLVARGPFSYIGGQQDHTYKTGIDGGNWSDPTFRIYRLATGKPTGACTESSMGVFTRSWSKGKATVDCATAKGALEFGMPPEQW